MKRQALAVLAMLSCAELGFAQAHGDQDVWHLVTEDSPVFSEAARDYHSAGIDQSDGPDVVLLLGASSEGAVVTVDIGKLNWAEGFTSSLINAQGKRLDRTIKLEDMRINTNGSGAPETVSFAVAANDLENFMHADIWKLSDGEITVDITMKGSRKAISAAIKARDRAG